MSFKSNGHFPKEKTRILLPYNVKKPIRFNNEVFLCTLIKTNRNNSNVKVVRHNLVQKEPDLAEVTQAAPWRASLRPLAKAHVLMMPASICFYLQFKSMPQFSSDWTAFVSSLSLPLFSKSTCKANCRANFKTTSRDAKKHGHTYRSFPQEKHQLCTWPLKAHFSTFSGIWSPFPGQEQALATKDHKGSFSKGHSGM